MHNRIRPYLRTLLLAFLVSAVSACGGGGGSGPVLIPGVESQAGRVNANTSAIQQEPVMVSNDSGKAIAVWMVEDGFNTKLVYSEYSGGQWSAVQGIVGSTAPFKYDIATDGAKFMLAYGVIGTIKARIYNGTGWEPEELLSTTPNSFLPTVASNGTGFAVGWRGMPAMPKNTAFARIHNGTGWEEATTIGPDEDHVGDPVMASDGTGYAMVWTSYDTLTSRYELSGNVYNGTAWLGAGSVESQTFNTGTPNLVGYAGGYVLVWDEMNRYNVYANMFNGTAWEGEQVIGTSAVLIKPPSIATNGTTLAVVWLSYSSGGSIADVYSAVFNGTGWETEEPLEAQSALSFYPRIVSNGSGYAAIWQNDGTGKPVKAAVYDGTGWGADIQVGVGNRTVWQYPAIAAIGDDYLSLWADNPLDVKYNIHAAGTWGTEASVSSISENAFSYEPAMASAGGISLALWTQYDKGYENVFSSVHKGASWETPELRHDHAKGGSVAASGNTFLAAWVRFSNVYAEFYNGTDWEGEVNIEASPNAAYGTVAATNGSQSLVAWNENTDVVAALHNGTAWEPEQVIDTGPGFPGNLSAVSNGTSFMVAWVQHDGAAQSVYANIYNGAGWDGATLLESLGTSASSVSTATDGSGYAVSWAQSSNIYSILYNGTAWELPVQADTTPLKVGSPSIASNGDSYAISWMQALSGAVYNSVQVSFLSGGSWSAPANVADLGTEVKAVSLSSAGGGYGLLWLQDDGAYDSLQFSEYNGIGWFASGTIESLDTDSIAPALVSDGDVYSGIWLQQNADPVPVNDVWARIGF